MEIHGRNSAVAKRLWNVLRITLYMARKGLVSKRKLIMDMNLVMNKRSKLLRKSLSNLMHHHHHSSSSRHHHVAARGYSFGVRDYEFSCSNSPNPVFFRVPNTKRKHYFPCINPPAVAEETEYLDLSNAVVLVPKTPEYTYHAEEARMSLSPSPSPSPVMSRSPFSVRVSNYSSEEFDEMDGETEQVDDEAEEFIRRFYEQLRAQGRVQLLQYQETQCQEMLARGT